MKLRNVLIFEILFWIAVMVITTIWSAHRYHWICNSFFLMIILMKFSELKNVVKYKVFDQ